MERTGLDTPTLDIPTEDVHLPRWTGRLPSSRRGCQRVSPPRHRQQRNIRQARCMGRSASKIKQMHVPLFHVNAFTAGPCTGNPAAVCLLDSWLDDEALRKVAAENNLSATAFLVSGSEGYQLRWFTPRCEIRLCGHATLAAGYVVLKVIQPDLNAVQFSTRFSGSLTVGKRDDKFCTDFPALIPLSCKKHPGGLSVALNLESNPSEILEVNDTYVVVFESEEAVRNLAPDFARLERLHPHVVAVTARGNDADFVSRYFAPSYGVPEDPVTGSVHCALTSYWSKRLKKSSLHAKQLSERTGELRCELSGERVILQGRAELTLKGTLTR
ncbi:MAG TPA: PhzF family phenazine biosynthesis protein [Candidatus Sulfotelmatobacter sp.]|nr:PhzF family phenazine biosynthesis protein [Candidatus Sulfotelmatobacter sp.]